MFPRLALLALPALAALAPVAVAQSPAPPSPDGAATLPPWIAADTAARSVRLELETTPGTPSASINGRREGGLTIVVPLGWTVTWRWRSTDTAATHSLVLVVQREKLPERGGRPAFPNAMTRMVTAGLPAGRTDETTFVAEEAGWYWLLCGVPTHALNGEWIEFRVDPAAKGAGLIVRER